MGFRQRQHILFIYLVIFLIMNIILYVKYISFIFGKQRVFVTLIYSGIMINSFNSPIIHLRLNTNICQTNFLTILDNHIAFLQISDQSSRLSLLLSNGYHHLDFILFDKIEQIEFYQGIDIAIGNQSLRVNVLDEKYKPVENITVYLELIDYSNINEKYQTNHNGEVIFHYLPNDIQIYIEAKCISTKRQAYVQINTLKYQNITLILKEINSSYDDEYDTLDRGYYAV